MYSTFPEIWLRNLRKTRISGLYRVVDASYNARTLGSLQTGLFTWPETGYCINLKETHQRHQSTKTRQTEHLRKASGILVKFSSLSRVYVPHSRTAKRDGRKCLTGLSASGQP